MSIFFEKETKSFFLEGKSITYAFFINDFGYAEHLYFGDSIARDDLRYSHAYGGNSTIASVPGTDCGYSYQQCLPEISFFGTGDYREPCVMVENKAGDRLTQLHYAGHEILAEKPAISGMPSMDGGETLVLHLRDSVSSFGADLYYTVYDDASVIARRIVYINGGKDDVILRRAYSFTLPIRKNDFEALTLQGAHNKERHIERIPMHHGVVSVDSKRTASSHTLNPFMALVSPNATEDSGDVYGISLVYSSSFVIKAEGDTDGTCHLSGGINDFDFAWVLEPGECFETPEAVLAFSSEGLGGMSRAYHDAYREHLISKGHVYNSRPLLINNWEATYFTFDSDKLCAIVDAVKGTGIDTFVLDDGWFGIRNNDRSGLGDWVVNESKLEGGLTRIIDHVHAAGMKFGLWFEPEMVNEDSELYRAHPDYAIGAPNRPHCYSRHQFVLDLTRTEVRDYIVSSVNRILSENAIDYVKWDFNRNITESWSVGRESRRQAEFAHRYALGLYDICDRIVLANPKVFFEGCAGGGGRFDPAMLYYFPQIWTSDDTDAEERTFIQYGTSLVYPLSAMSCHVSECPNHQTGRTTPFKTRADIAHLGATGYELDTTKWSDEDRRMVADQIADYREMEELVLKGDLYRIDDPHRSNHFTFMLVSKDKSCAHVTHFRSKCSTNNPPKRLRLKGLDPERRYFIKELGITLHGSTLMGVGLIPSYKKGDYMTVTYTLTEA